MANPLSVTREYNRIFSIVRDQVEPLLFDNVTTRTSTLFRMKEMGAIQTVGGRPHMRFNIVKELPTTAAYTDLDTISPVRADPVTSAIFEWKQLQCPVQVSGLDMIKTGDGAEIDLLEMFIQAAELSLRDALGGSSIGIFSDGNETDLDKVSGLQTFFTSSTTTGLVGALNRATTTVWQHQTQNVSSDFSSNGLTAFRSLYRTCSRFDEVPDSIALNGATLDNFERDLTSTFQVNLPIMDVGPGDQRMIDAGFGNIRYKGAVVYNDDGVPANAGYFLNLAKHIRLIIREGRNAEIGDFVKSGERDDLVSFILWAGNLVTTNLARGGLLQNGDTY